MFRFLIGISLILGLFCNAQVTTVEHGDASTISPTSTKHYETTGLLDSATLVSMVSQQSQVPELATTVNYEKNAVRGTATKLRDYKPQITDEALDDLLDKIIAIVENSSKPEENHTQTVEDDFKNDEGELDDIFSDLDDDMVFNYEHASEFDQGFHDEDTIDFDKVFHDEGARESDKLFSYEDTSELDVFNDEDIKDFDQVFHDEDTRESDKLFSDEDTSDFDVFKDDHVTESDKVFNDEDSSDFDELLRNLLNDDDGSELHKDDKETGEGQTTEIAQVDVNATEGITASTSREGHRKRYRGYKKRYNGYKGRRRGSRRRYSKDEDSSFNTNRRQHQNSRSYRRRQPNVWKIHGHNATTEKPQDDLTNNETTTETAAHGTKQYTTKLPLNLVTQVLNISELDDAQITDVTKVDAGTEPTTTGRGYRGRHRGNRRRHPWFAGRRTGYGRRHGARKGTTATPEDDDSTDETGHRGRTSKRHHRGHKGRHGHKATTPIPNFDSSNNETTMKPPMRAYKKRPRCFTKANGDRKCFWYGRYGTFKRRHRTRHGGYDDRTGTTTVETASTRGHGGFQHSYNGRNPSQVTPSRQYHLVNEEQSSIHNMGRNSEYYTQYFTHDGTFFVKYVHKTSTQFDVRPTKQSSYWPTGGSTSSEYDGVFVNKETNEIPEAVPSTTALYPSTDGYASSTSTKYDHTTSASTQSLSTSSKKYYLARGEQRTIYDGPSNSAYSTKYLEYDGSTFVEYIPTAKSQTPKIKDDFASTVDYEYYPIASNDEYDYAFRER